jgi:hypothetical protein
MVMARREKDISENLLEKKWIRAENRTRGLERLFPFHAERLHVKNIIPEFGEG